MFFINMYKNNNKTINNEREKQLNPSLHRFDSQEIVCTKYLSYLRLIVYSKL